jgi:dUTP pyrophosphatase
VATRSRMRQEEPVAEVAQALQYKRLRPSEPCVGPKRQHRGDAGLDLAISRYTQVFPGQSVQMSTNMAVAIPLGYFGLVLPRSSTLWRNGLHVSTGTIDSGYRGEVMVLARNLTDKATTVNVGDRIAQMLVLPVPQFEFEEVEELEEGDRGPFGFGSTGD